MKKCPDPLKSRPLSRRRFTRRPACGRPWLSTTRPRILDAGPADARTSSASAFATLNPASAACAVVDIEDQVAAPIDGEVETSLAIGHREVPRPAADGRCLDDRLRDRPIARRCRFDGHARQRARLGRGVDPGVVHDLPLGLDLDRSPCAVARPVQLIAPGADAESIATVRIGFRPSGQTPRFCPLLEIEMRSRGSGPPR